MDSHDVGLTFFGIILVVCVAFVIGTFQVRYAGTSCLDIKYQTEKNND